MSEPDDRRQIHSGCVDLLADPIASLLARAAHPAGSRRRGCAGYSRACAERSATVRTVTTADRAEAAP